MTEQELKKIGEQGLERINELLRQAKIRMSNPEYRKKYYPQMSENEEAELMEFLER